MKKFTISVSTKYDVLLGPGILKDSGAHLSQLFPPGKVALITDSNVNGIYGDLVSRSLEASGFQVFRIPFPSGEHSKNIVTYSNILDSLAERCFVRSDVVFALGGGVTCDMAGFVAGTYMRGLPLVMAPTTYQSALDTSLGGKSGVNLLNGKNLVGVFWQPSLVLTDTDTFKTLSEKQLNDGLAEAVKYSAISDQNLLSHILERDYDYVLERCISIKKSLVEADERETHLRQLLNFGHTIGHGIEKLSLYSTTHGQAIAKGMIAEAAGAFREGHTSYDLSGILREALDTLGFDTSLDYDPEEIYQLALTDKKIFDGKINMTIPEAPGKCTLKKLSLEELSSLIRAGLK